MKEPKTLSLLFLRRGDEILLAMKKRGFGAGRWNGVGGKVEASETIEQAMVREAEEEIGVTPTLYEKVGEIQFNEFLDGQPSTMNVHVFISTQWQNEPSESEEMKPQWFAISDIPYDKMWPDDRYWLPNVIAGDIITAQFTLDENDAIVSYTITKNPVLN